MGLTGCRFGRVLPRELQESPSHLPKRLNSSSTGLPAAEIEHPTQYAGESVSPDIVGSEF